MKYYTIYKITNSINGKYYIGKHITENLNDGYMGSGKYIKSAVAKHGKDNFVKEILILCENEEDMNNKERELIDHTDSLSYNLTVGGIGGWDYVNSNGLSNTPENKKRKSDTMKIYWDEEKRKSHSDKMKKYNVENGTSRYTEELNRRYADTEYKQKFIDKMKIVNADTEKRKKAGQKIKELWESDEDFKNKMKKRKHGSNSEKLKEKWKDPIWKEMMLNRRKKNETNKNN